MKTVKMFIVCLLFFCFILSPFVNASDFSSANSQSFRDVLLQSQTGPNFFRTLPVLACYSVANPKMQTEETISAKKKVFQKGDINFGIGLRSGIMFKKSGDLDKSAETVENMTLSALERVTTQDVNLVYPIHVDLYAMYNLTENHKIGLSMGYQHLMMRDYQDEWNLVPPSFMKSSYGLNALSEAQRTEIGLLSHIIPIQLFCMMNMRFIHPGLYMRTTAALLIASAVANYSFTQLVSGIAVYNRTGKMTSSVLGSQFSLGFEYFLCRTFALKTFLGYTFLKFSGFTGKLKTNDGSSMNSRLVMWNSPDGERIWYRDKSLPLNEYYREAQIAMGGFFLMLGVQYYFPFCILSI